MVGGGEIQYFSNRNADFNLVLFDLIDICRVEIDARTAL